MDSTLAILLTSVYYLVNMREHTALRSGGAAACGGQRTKVLIEFDEC
jgi:hypothetical protein